MKVQYVRDRISRRDLYHMIEEFEQRTLPRLIEDPSQRLQVANALYVKLDLKQPMLPNPEDRERHLDTPIEDIDLSMRAYKVLGSLNIKTVRDVTRINFFDLWERQACGVKTIEEIRRTLLDPAGANYAPYEPPTEQK